LSQFNGCLLVLALLESSICGQVKLFGSGKLIGPSGTPGSAGGNPTITFIAHTATAASSTHTSSPSIDTSAGTGNHCFVSVAETWYTPAGVAPPITDSFSNTYTELTPQVNTTGQQSLVLWYSANATCGVGHTFTFTTSALSYVSIEVQVFAGPLSSPLDQQNGTPNGSGTTINTGSVTPFTTGELVIAASSFDSAMGSIAINSSLAITDTSDFSGGANYGSSAAYIIQTSIVTVNPRWTFGNSQNSIAVIATFK
jgi:hypothetical protein